MFAKLRLVFTITMVFLSFYATAQQSYWQKTEMESNASNLSKQQLGVEKGQIFRLNSSLFIRALQTNSTNKTGITIIYFPDENGISVAFSVEEAPLFSPQLAKKYPYIKSYKGVALNDLSKTIRFSLSHKGVESMITKAGRENATFMHKTAGDTYIVYKRSAKNAKELSFTCNTKDVLPERPTSISAKLINDQNLRKFRVAIAASGEYTLFHGGTKADALAAINATLTRVNGIFERDLSVTLELIANTDDVIYLDPETDPFTGNLSTEAQNTFTSVIGEANYDIGHLFNQQDNALDGNAGFIGAVCQDNRKGSGYTTLSEPQGDAFDIDLVIHEMGHQFGANHSFSHTTESTNVQVEPASGSTIMGYAGITGVNNVALNSDPYFHYVSIVQMKDYLQTISCGETIPLTNTPPVLSSALPDYTIPIGTAFVLEAAATDADSANVLSYGWEQIDNGIVTQASFGPNTPVGANFRSLPPTLSPIRYFPNLDRVLAGQLIQENPVVNSAWETVSNVSRELNFSITVRDNALNGGQSVSDEVLVNVSDEAGPFQVTSQTITNTFNSGEVFTVTWDVANTNLAPVLATNVDILLSTDGGQTFPIVLKENVENNGIRDIILPNLTTTEARIMVKPVNNIFYAVNASNFSIIPSELILNFDDLSYTVCTPNNLAIDFTYETNAGFDEESTFSTNTLPAGVAVIFDPVSADTNATPVTMTLTGLSSLSEGSYPIEVVSTSISETKTVILNVNIFDTNFEDVVLVSPGDNFEDASTEEQLTWVPSFESNSFDVQIATDATFTNITEQATVSNPFYNPTQLTNNTTYFWRVKPKNECGEGDFGTIYSFSTSQFNCLIRSTTGLPLVISPTSTPTITSKIVFYEDLPVADINVSLNIEHTYLSDLVVSLISPAGTKVVLISNSCGNSRNLEATFDDSGPTFVCGVNPAISGTVRPLGNLNAFQGESILGEWILEIKDTEPSDGGRLLDFVLDMCVEGEFRPDSDLDGVYDDGDDLCLGTPLGQEVDVSGCAVYRFPNENFNISLQSESCINAGDGQILVIPKLGLNYSAQVSSDGFDITQNFTNSFNLSNLSAGSYNICITGTDGIITYEAFCFNLQITAPQLLNVTSLLSADGSKVTLTLAGAEVYSIQLNDELINTDQNSFVVNLPKGLNALKVFTDIPCQGIYEEVFANYDTPIIVPNPVVDIAQVMVLNVGEPMKASIFTVDGRMIKSFILESNLEGYVLPMGSLDTGMYYIRLEAKNYKGTSKVLKR